MARARYIWGEGRYTYDDSFWFTRYDNPKFMDGKKDAEYPISRFVGLEIEGSGFKDGATKAQLQKLQAVIKKWDGDIAHDVDYEIRTSPARGDTFVKQTREICAALAEAGSECNSQCGGHIHVDLRDFKNEPLRRLLLICARVEKVMLRTQSVRRAASHWCRPFAAKIPVDRISPYKRDYKAIINAVKDPYRYSGSVADRQFSSSVMGRYNAINFLAYADHKTVEIRMHRGTHNPNEILPWASAWCDIVDSAQKLSIKAAAAFPNTLEDLRGIVNPKAMLYIDSATKKNSKGWAGR